MTAAREEVRAPRSRGASAARTDSLEEIGVRETTSPSDVSRGAARSAVASEVPQVRKAAIVLSSLEQSVASQLLSYVEQSVIEAVTWEIARLDRVDPAERADVLEEFYSLGLRRLCFVFDDLVKMSDSDIRAAFQEEDLESWALALAGAAASQRAKLLGALAVLSADRLRQKLDRLGPFRLSDAEAAQLEIAESFRRLHDRGRVNLPAPGGRDEVLV